MLLTLQCDAQWFVCGRKKENWVCLCGTSLCAWVCMMNKEQEGESERGHWWSFREYRVDVRMSESQYCVLTIGILCTLLLFSYSTAIRTASGFQLSLSSDFIFKFILLSREKHQQMDLFPPTVNTSVFLVCVEVVGQYETQSEISLLIALLNPPFLSSLLPSLFFLSVPPSSYLSCSASP